jgi:photosynthesis system II assembly factor YCF48-like protein
VGANGLILRSQDRGESWLQLLSGLDADLFDIFVSSSNDRVIVAGAHGTLLVSEDGGQRFVKRSTGQSAPLVAIAGTPDGHELWVAGEGGIIFHSVDWGQTWQRENQDGPVVNFQALVATQDGRRVAALGEMNNQGQLLISTDAGKSWNPALSSAEQIYGILGGYPEGNILHIWSHSYSSLTHFTIRDGTPLPVIRNARLGPTISGKSRLHFDGDRLDALEPKDVRVWAANESNRGELRLLRSVVADKPSDNGSWSVTFDAREAGVLRGEKVYVDIEIQAQGWRHRYAVSPEGLVVDPFGFWREHWLWVASLGMLLIMLATLSLLLWLKPGALLSIYTLDRHLGDLSSWLSKPLQILLTSTILPAFARHPRVLDAWTKQHRARARAAFEATPTSRATSRYVPLPVRLRDQGDFVMEHPKAEEFTKLFSRSRVVVQIVGPGGAGKTSLAVQLGRWLFDEDNDSALMGHPVIVVLLDEDTTEIRSAVKARLRGWLELDEDVPDRLLDVLLKKRRLVVFFDRVSERRPEVVKSVERIHGRIGLNALLVTSRRPLDFEGSPNLSLYPEPLGSGTLLYFVTALLQNHENLGGFGQLTDQAAAGRAVHSLA